MNPNIKSWTEIEAEKEQGHTALPWHIGMKPGPMVYGKLGEQIADCRGLDESGHNARFICKAVNSHEELVATLQAIQKILGEALPVDYKRDCFAALKLADEAMAKSKGEA